MKMYARMLLCVALVQGIEWAAVRHTLSEVQSAVGKEDEELAKFSVRRLWKLFQAGDDVRSVAIGFENSGAGWEIRGRIDSGSIGGTQIVGVHGGTRVFAKGLDAPAVIGNVSKQIEGLMSGMYGSCRTDAPPHGYKWVSLKDCGVNHYQFIKWTDRGCLKAPIVVVDAWTDTEEALLHFKRAQGQVPKERDDELKKCVGPSPPPKQMPEDEEELPSYDQGFRLVGEL